MKKLNIFLLSFVFSTSFLIFSVHAETDSSYSTYEADHCVIKYMDGVSLETAKAAADAYETAYIEVGKDLGEYYPRKLNIYLYKNQSTLVEGMILFSGLDPKWAHFFDRGGSIRPYKNKLHVNINVNLLKYISHEYTHTVIQELYDTVRGRGITMCGVIPVTVMLKAAMELGAKVAELIDYKTSGDTSGDYSSVVGYAGLIVS